ncbi:MAG: DUF4105 domain-containing protein [Ferruginibacter sp.]
MSLAYFIIGIFAYFLIGTPAYCQDSSRLRISLLTCTPGEELYSTFGHSALRVIDSNAVSDIIFNYGTFDFNDPDFYSKFIRGKLLYVLSAEKLEDFLFTYQIENRGVAEQLLDLTGPEKIRIKHFLAENLKEENRWYKYDFTFDNCTSRLRDIIVKYKEPQPQLPAVMPSNFTFRNGIHHYLNFNKHHWSKLGIDILLGSRMDKAMTTAQQQFLPDNLMYALDSSRNTRVVAAKKDLFIAQKTADKFSWFTPLLLFSVITIFWILAGFSQNKIAKAVLGGLDRLLFFSTGLLGILLLFMWWGTDHFMTKDNYNLLWALPSNAIMAFFTRSKKNRVKKYFLFVAVLYAALLLLWFFLPQQMNNGLIPVIILLMIRSFLIHKNSRAGL